jgi:hypothetical protein
MRIAAREVWSWAYANFLPNVQRGVLAEYLVAAAVGATESPRKVWETVDVTSPNGLKIEVKSAAYLQDWHQSKPSSIRFDISAKRAWDEKTGT